MTRKCVIHIIATNFFGGPEKQIVHHCKSMDSQHWRMIVCSFLEGKPRNELLEKAAGMGLETSALNTVSAYNPLIILELANLIRQKQPDLIVTHGYRPFILCLCLKHIHRKPIIAFSRGFTEENLKIKVVENLYKFILHFSDLMVAVSEGHKRVLMKYGLKDEKIEVVHNAVFIDAPLENKSPDNLKTGFEKFGIPENGKIVVSAGRLSPEKGHQFLVEAIEKMGKKTRDTFFVFCGEGPSKKNLEEQVQKLGISEQCRFLGFRRDLQEIFYAMDLLVLPSLMEGLPNVVLEAFAHAKPVIATSVGGVPEVVEDGINGILVPPKRSDLLAEAIERCLSSPERAKKMGEAGYRKVKSEFTFEAQTRKLEEIYHKVLVASEV